MINYKLLDARKKVSEAIALQEKAKKQIEKLPVGISIAEFSKQEEVAIEGAEEILRVAQYKMHQAHKDLMQLKACLPTTARK